MSSRGEQVALESKAASSAEGAARAVETQGTYLLDLSGIDLKARTKPRSEIETRNPHRGVMSLLDWVVWQAPDHTSAVAVHHVRSDEFWVPGHFPAKPIMPGVLQVEAGAQLACYQWLVRNDGPFLVAFLRIEDCSFRSMVEPGDDLYVLCKDVKFGRRRFIADVQGVANGRVTFDARVSGMPIQDPGLK